MEIVVNTVNNLNQQHRQPQYQRQKFQQVHTALGQQHLQKKSRCLRMRVVKQHMWAPLGKPQHLYQSNPVPPRHQTPHIPVRVTTAKPILSLDPPQSLTTRPILSLEPLRSQTPPPPTSRCPPPRR